MPIIAMRSATDTLPGLAGATVLMRIGGIQGTSGISGYEEWMALTSFDWGGARTINRMADRSGRNRAIAVAPQMRAVQVVRGGDSVSPEIWDLMLSTTKKLVEFVWLRTGGDGTEAFMKLALRNALIVRMSEHSDGHAPEESISFTYEEIELMVINVGNRLTGPQDVVSYVLPQAVRG